MTRDRSAWIRRVPPSICVLCGDRGAPSLDLCDACRNDFELALPACIRCAAHLPSGAAARYCVACQRRVPPIHRTFALFRYEPPLSHLIQQFKFHGDMACGRVLANLFASELVRANGLTAEWVIPVPLNIRRLRERGFNQAEVLARAAKNSAAPVIVDRLVRSRQTPAQTTLSAARRRSNVRNAFLLRGDVAGRHVAIVDDVVTTGATVNEIARVLLQQGARQIDVWTLARA